MSVLVIGAGLVGAQIARILVERGVHPVLFDRAPQRDAIDEIVPLGQVKLFEGDVLTPLTLSEVIREHGISKVIHTAAYPGLTKGAQRNPYGAIRLNIMGTVNVLEAARIHRLERVIVSSSNVLTHFIAGGVGDPDPTLPMREEAFPRPTTFYASTKLAIENLGLNYATWCDVDFGAVRYGAVAGPWAGLGGGGSTNAFRESIESALRGEEALIPESTMEWIYSKDAAMGTVAALEASDLKSRVFNLSMGRLSSPQDFAAALKMVVPYARIRIASPPNKGVTLPNMQRTSDLELAREVLGFMPQFDLSAAISDMVTWLEVTGRTTWRSAASAP